MKIISADYLLPMDDKDSVIQNGAVAYTDKIIEISSDTAAICAKYPDAEFFYCGKNSVLMPSLINPHLHLEFSADKTSFRYGNFIEWLSSVIKKRGGVSEKKLISAMQKELNNLKKTGVGAIGAVSSFGKDMEILASSPLRVIYFVEILGTSKERFEGAKNGFLQRFEIAESKNSDRFEAAVSVHSPYSCSPEIVDFGVEFAKQNSLKMTTHFLESEAERAWLEGSSGEFLPFFGSVFGLQTSFFTPEEFLKKFDGLKTLFVHCTNTTPDEIKKIKDSGSDIVHCPVSNRLLGQKLFGLKTATELAVRPAIGTDGLSSNFSLSMWNELRCALFGYDDIDLKILPFLLLKSVTANGAEALGIESGILREGKNADMIAFRLPDRPDGVDCVALQAILHTDKVDKLIISGEVI